MLTFKNFLSEITDKPAELIWKLKSEKYLKAIATIGERKILFSLGRWPQHTADIAKNITNYGLTFSELDEDDEDDGTYDATGSGNEFQVFATVKAFLLECLKIAQPSAIHFEADKTSYSFRTSRQSRVSLYKKFGKRWHPDGYHFELIANTEESEYFAYVKDGVKISKDYD